MASRMSTQSVQSACLVSVHILSNRYFSQPKNLQLTRNYLLDQLYFLERNYNEIKTMAYVIGHGLKFQKSCHTSGSGPEMYQGNVTSVSLLIIYLKK